jgi:hypothetical protein
MSAHLFDLDAEHVATTTDDWYTPRWVFKAAELTFDMDVAAPVDPDCRTVPARRYVTAAEDGLSVPWEGVVWCNPPYSKATPWVDKWSSHSDGLVLLAARSKIPWRGTVLQSADALALLTLDFHRPDGSIAQMQWAMILAARGPVCVEALARVAAVDQDSRGGYLVRPA